MWYVGVPPEKGGDVTDRTETLTHQLWLWRKRYLVTDTYISQQWKVVEGRRMRTTHVISVR